MKSLKLKDFTLFVIMAVLAGCGLIYEYLLSHYTGRVLGAVETVIFAMIGVMIVSMGIGAFAARYIVCPFTGFAWLELIIAILGGSGVLVIAGVFAFTHTLPARIAETFGMPPDLVPMGGIVKDLLGLAEIVPYVVGLILGALIGAEIPLIARVREAMHGCRLTHNTGDIYGVDYIGAGFGAAIWVGFMLSLEPTLAASITAAANLCIGLVFLFLFFDQIKWRHFLLVAHIIVGSLIVTIGQYGPEWDAAMEDILYEDRVIYRMTTRYQRMVITERTIDPLQAPVINFYINGRTQFSSRDEHIYHALLTYPAMAASARHDKILIVGGGDGLALRDVLRWSPKQVVLIDIDEDIIDLFKSPRLVDGVVINERLLQLNRNALQDSRVNIIVGDAFKEVDHLLETMHVFDTIIVDLPDPSHPDLNKLYTARFYVKLSQLLAGDGAMAVQSTSPYHAKNAFLSIGKTLRHSGFPFVEQYHHNVPSFGEWGWTIGAKAGEGARARLTQIEVLPIDDGWTTRGKLNSVFEFGQGYFSGLSKIKVNRLGNSAIYQYHHRAWRREQGVYSRE